MGKVISKLKGKIMSRKSFQEKFVQSLGLNQLARSNEQVTDLNSSGNESFVSKFQRSMFEMEVERSEKKLKKRKRSEDSGLDSSDYLEVTSAEQSEKKRKSEFEAETSLEESDGKRKKKKKKDKGKKKKNMEGLQEISSVAENDQTPEDPGTGDMVENRQTSPSRENDLSSNKENEMFEESAEGTDQPPETPTKKKKKKKKRKEEMEREEPQEAAEVTENDQDLVPQNTMVEMKTETLEEIEGEVTGEEGPGLTINEMYRMPKQAKVSAEIYSACEFIMGQQVEVSLLNRVYTGHCVPREKKFRKELRRKYNARFGGYSPEQDMLILQRFKTLVTHLGFTSDTARQFLQSVLEMTSGKKISELHKSKFRTIGVRNIFGLYVGQVGTFVGCSHGII